MTIDMDCCFYCGHRASELTQIRIAVKPLNTPHRWKVVGVACNTCADKYETQIIPDKQIIHEALKKQREICAEVYRTNPEECWGCMNESILNASEPEI